MIACKQLYFFARWQGQLDPDGQRLDVYRQFGRALQDSSADIAWQALMQLREIPSPQLRSVLVDYIAKPHDVQSQGVAREILQEIESP
jgi:hypothetical protein